MKDSKFYFTQKYKEIKTYQSSIEFESRLDLVIDMLRSNMIEALDDDRSGCSLNEQELTEAAQKWLDTEFKNTPNDMLARLWIAALDGLHLGDCNDSESALIDEDIKIDYKVKCHTNDYVDRGGDSDILLK